MNKTEILAALKKKVGESVRLPSNIDFSIENKVLTMTLLKNNCFDVFSSKKDRNMQTPGNAFEAWAFALYANLGPDKVIMDLKEQELPDFKLGECSGHYGRFLYRALRLSEQYSWFELSAPLKKKVFFEFKQYIEDPSKSFINNFSPIEAQTKVRPKKKGNKSESEVEAEFAGAVSENNRCPWLANALKQQGLLIQQTDVHRQLAVGLFEEDDTAPQQPKKENTVFVGKHAAVDLWTIADDILIPIELKTENKTMGAITELFFYSNYLYDVYIKNNNIHPLNHEGNKGYQKILSRMDKLKKVKGFMLLDEESVHPLMTDDLIKVMNNSAQPGIQYGHILKYTL